MKTYRLEIHINNEVKYHHLTAEKNDYIRRSIYVLLKPKSKSMLSNKFNNYN